MSTHTSSSSMAEDSCLICSDPIRCKDYIWTCNCCCISMHLSCIKLWINNRNQEIPKEDDKQGKMIYNWSCPQCNYKYVEAMPRYYCYCGKYSNPDFERDLPAHSCGKICNRKRGIYCQHPCP